MSNSKPKTLGVLVVEDNDRLRESLLKGFASGTKIAVTGDCDSGETAIRLVGEQLPDAVLLDVQLAGELNGIEAAVALRREYPRLPIVFYSIQDDDNYYRQFLDCGILSHYAYVKKSNYLLPEQIAELLQDVAAGRSFVDPEIESRVQAVRHRDQNSPLQSLEPMEQKVARRIAAGASNEQIAKELGYKDKRTIARINGQIYSLWGLNETSSDEKVARTRAALIVRENKWISWDDTGKAMQQNENGDWEDWPE